MRSNIDWLKKLGTSCCRSANKANEKKKEEEIRYLKPTNSGSNDFIDDFHLCSNNCIEIHFKPFEITLISEI